MNNGRFTIVIPWRDSGDKHRQRIFEWILSRYKYLFPEGQIELCDNGSERFSRGGSRNAGVSFAERDFILLADADTVPYLEWIYAGAKLLEEGVSWVLPYGSDGYFNVNRESTEHVLNELDPKDDFDPKNMGFDYQLLSWAGQILTTKDAFEAAGGYDERFTGWGYEDNAFKEAMDTLVGQHGRVAQGHTAHLWHPAPVTQTWQQPDIITNRQLYGRYKSRSGNPELMKELVKDNGNIYVSVA